VQVDQKARDLAALKAQTLERIAKAKLSKVEAEKSKTTPIHYQDPMDGDNEEAPASTKGTSEVLKESPA
jgi:hypothetical protein